MIRNFFVFVFLLTFFNAFAQKGIFKKGTITPKTYQEEIDFSIKMFTTKDSSTKELVLGWTASERF